MSGGAPVDNSVNISGSVASGNTFGDHATVTTTVVIYQTAAGADRPSLAGGGNPYLGLLAFTEADADRFFGREALVERLWEKFQRRTAAPYGDVSRLLAILGPSGSGKSSVARAGLLAQLGERLRNDGRGPHLLAAMMPGRSPVQELARLLAKLATNDAPDPELVGRTRDYFVGKLAAPDIAGVYDGLRGIAADLAQPLVLLVDQFEEIYSACDVEADRKAFIGNLLHAAQDASGRVSLIITMRSDFLGATQADNALNQVIAGQNVFVPTLSKDELRRAIAEPARRATPPFPLDEDTIARLVNETLDRNGALPLLQFVLVAIWEGLAKGRPAPDTVDDLGGVGGALGGKAEELYQSLAEPEKLIAQRAFMAMVAFNDNGQPTRRQAPVSQLVADDEAIPDDEELAAVQAVVNQFALPGSRLVTLSEAEGVQTVEVTHEAIFRHWARLKTWLDEGVDDIRLHRRVAEAATLWEQNGRQDGSLWRPPDLDLLRALAAKPEAGLTREERAFFRASEAGQTRRRRSFLAGVAALVAVTVVAVGAGLYAAAQSAQAAVQRSNVLAAASRQANERGDATRALLLAMEALPAAKAESPKFAAASAALQAALLNLREIRTLVDSPDLSEADFVPGTSRLYAKVDAGTFWISDATGERIQKKLDGVAIPTSDAAERIQMKSGDPNIQSSGDGKRLLVRFADGAAETWNGATRLAKFKHLGTALLTPDGNRVLRWSAGRLEVLDAATGAAKTSAADVAPDETARPVFAADGHVLVTASGGDVVIRDGSGRPLRTLSMGQDSPKTLILSKDARRLITVADLGAQIWNVETGAPVGATLQFGGILQDVGFLGDGDAVYGIGFTEDDHGRPTLSAVIWDAATGVQRRRLEGGYDELDGHVYGSMVVSADGSRFATRPKGGPLTVYDGRGLGPLATVETFPPDGLPVFSPDGRRFLSVVEQEVQARTTDTGQPLGRPIVGDIFKDARFTPDGRHIMTQSKGGALRLWTPPGEDSTVVSTGDIFGQGSYASVRAEPGDRFVTALAWPVLAPDGVELPAGVRSWRLDILDLLVGQRTKATPVAIGRDDPEFRAEDVRGVELSPKGLLLLTAGKRAELWDATGQRHGPRVDDCPPPDSPFYPAVRSARFSPDGGKIVVVCTSSRASIWDVAKRNRIALSSGATKPGSPPAPQDQVDIAEFSASSALLATGSVSGVAAIWDVTTGRLKQVLAGPRSSIDRLAFSPDGTRVVTASGDRTARIWDVASGKMLVNIPDFGGDLAWVVFTPDGRRVVFRAGDAISVRDASTGLLLATWDRKVEQSVPAPLFSTDGRRMTFVETNRISTWTLPEILYGRALVAEACRRKPGELTAAERLTYGLRKSSAACPTSAKFRWPTWVGGKAAGSGDPRAAT